jgi:LmbE family N-acetylglucosaminyl deacetylase
MDATGAHLASLDRVKELHCRADVVVAIFAHPADAEVAAGATLSRWAHAGGNVTILNVCRGDKGAPLRVDGDQLAVRRRDESLAAAGVLGAESVTLDIDDGLWARDAEMLERIVAEVRARRPYAVITSDPRVLIAAGSHWNHHDHRLVGAVVAEAVATCAGNPNYFPEQAEPWQPSLLMFAATAEHNSYVEVSEGIEAKAAALLCHRSQIGVGNELGVDVEAVHGYVAARARAEGQHVGRSAVECFYTLVCGEVEDDRFSS